ncbi:MAG TPA: MAB_1171c family putative transporter [Actinokineospora sp.]|nr:MAB_1171c family putative transporter [Actinokineospora sp.]
MNYAVVLTTVQGVALYGALAWKVYQLARAPWDVALRFVTLCLACAGAAYPFGIAAGHVAMTQMMAGPMVFMWAQEVFLIGLIYMLICFFLFSALDARSARRRARRQAIPLVATLLALTGVALAAPRGTAPADYPISVVSMFFLVADTYVVYGFVVAYRWTLRYAGRAGPRLARGLRLTSAGIAAMALATAILMVAVGIRWITGDPPNALTASSALVLVVGILLFIIGVSYPGVAMRIAAVPIWFDHLRAYRRMRALWSALHAAFPQDALVRVPVGPWCLALTPQGVHRRYYRRVIECRDGLVRLSPYLNNVTDEPSALAGDVLLALDAHANRVAVPPVAKPIAMPDRDGLDADVRELVQLSKALQTAT